MDHNCLEELLKEKNGYELAPGMGIFTLDGFEAKNDSDKPVIVFILSEEMEEPEIWPMIEE